MNPVIKAKWVAALRSGKYKQAQGSLRQGNKFCCLGVLCDLHSEETGNEWGRDAFEFEYMGFTGTLPEEVQKWAGLRGEKPEVVPDVDLADLNDGDYMHNGPVSFKKIADIIEVTL